jgi:hypothetical protein
VLLMALGAGGPALSADAPREGDAARTLMERTEISGSLRGSYWRSSRQLTDDHDVGVTATWLRLRSDLVPALSLVADGWLMNDHLFDADATRARLREGYLDIGLGPVDVRVGKQIIAWGRADRINPTDNLTPRDFTLLVPEDADQRHGTPAVMTTYHVGNVSLTGVWLATFEPHVIPIQTPPAPFVLLRGREPRDPVSQFAFKVDQTGGAVDWSVSYFDGYNLYPDLSVRGVSFTGVEIAPTYHRIRVVGADAATVWGSYGLRTEMAYTFTEQAGRPGVTRPFLFMVAGVDRTVLGSLYFNVQLALRVVSDFRDPERIADPVQRAVATAQAAINDQLDEVSETVALRISKKWRADTLETEVAAAVGLVRQDFAVRPKIRYAITDRLRVTVGADIFRGPTPSFFGRLRDMSTAYAEVRWDF